MAHVTGTGANLPVGSKLGHGGQGDIFEVDHNPALAFKWYNDKTLADARREQRIRVMIANRPAQWREPSGHVVLAWPTETVFENTRFVGFLMPRVDVSSTKEIHHIANPSDRERPEAKWSHDFDWHYLVATATNLASAVAALHQANVVFADFNEKNILVGDDARVTLVDCDSMQVTDPASGERFLCGVGRPESTPPEVDLRSAGSTVRAPSSDLFGLAIYIHQLLLDGEHPYRGKWNGSGQKPDVPELARQGRWTHGGSGDLEPRTTAVGIDVLPAHIIAMFRRAFVDGATAPDARPSASEWHAALSALRHNLVVCTAHSNHVYSNHLRNCPWCANEARRATTVPTLTQVSLPRAGMSTATSVSRPTAQPLHTGAQTQTGTPSQTATQTTPAPRRGRGLVVAAAIVALAGVLGATDLETGRDIHGENGADVDSHGQ